LFLSCKHEYIYVLYVAINVGTVQKQDQLVLHSYDHTHSFHQATPSRDNENNGNDDDGDDYGNDDDGDDYGNDDDYDDDYDDNTITSIFHIQ